jgi:hypothetical protein
MRFPASAPRRIGKVSCNIASTPLSIEASLLLFVWQKRAMAFFFAAHLLLDLIDEPRRYLKYGVLNADGGDVSLFVGSTRIAMQGQCYSIAPPGTALSSPQAGKIVLVEDFMSWDSASTVDLDGAPDGITTEGDNVGVGSSVAGGTRPGATSQCHSTELPGHNGIIGVAFDFTWGRGQPHVKEPLSGDGGYILLPRCRKLGRDTRKLRILSHTP